MGSEIIKTVFVTGDVLQNALELLMEQYLGGRRFESVEEGLEYATALQFAKYVLERPQELEDAKKLVEQVIKDNETRPQT